MSQDAERIAEEPALPPVGAPSPLHLASAVEGVVPAHVHASLTLPYPKAQDLTSTAPQEQQQESKESLAHFHTLLHMHITDFARISASRCTETERGTDFEFPFLLIDISVRPSARSIATRRRHHKGCDPIRPLHHHFPSLFLLLWCHPSRWRDDSARNKRETLPRLFPLPRIYVTVPEDPLLADFARRSVSAAASAATVFLFVSCVCVLFPGRFGTLAAVG